MVGREKAVCAWCKHKDRTDNACKAHLDKHVDYVVGVRYTRARCVTKNYDGQCLLYEPSLLTRMFRRLGVREPLQEDKK